MASKESGNVKQGDWWKLGCNDEVSLVDIDSKTRKMKTTNFCENHRNTETPAGSSG